MHVAYSHDATEKHLLFVAIFSSIDLSKWKSPHHRSLNGISNQVLQYFDDTDWSNRASEAQVTSI